MTKKESIAKGKARRQMTKRYQLMLCTEDGTIINNWGIDAIPLERSEIQDLAGYINHEIAVHEAKNQ